MSVRQLPNPTRANPTVDLTSEAVADDRAQGEDGFGAVQAPSRASYVEAVGDDSLNNQHGLEGSDVSAG